MTYEDKETFVLYGVEYSASRSDSNALSLAITKTPESRRYCTLDALVSSPGAKALSAKELLEVCEERAELEPVLAGMVLRELKIRGMA